MKRFKLFAAIMAILLIVMACDIGPLSIDLGGKDDGDNGSAGGTVEAGVDSPGNGATLPMGPVEVAYHATSTDGISSIELSINGEVVSSINTPESDQKVVALKYTWQPSVSGSHTIRVRALSNKGVWSDYASATVNVESAQPDVPAPPPPPPSQPDQPEEPAEPEPTPTPKEMTIFNIEHNRDIFYYGGGTCGSREITISADITHPDDAFAAILFIRFWDKEGEGLTKWDSGRAMSRKSDEHFSVTLFSESIPNYAAFDYSVMYYQIVVQDKPGNRLARTEVIKELRLERCP